jgi:Clr5 domain
MTPQHADVRVPTRSGVQYTPEQWAERKEIITQLYATEGKSLREVKEFLRNRYDFRPTCVKFYSLIENIPTDS